MANDDEGTPCSGALGGGSPRVRQITQQRVERCGRAGQYGQAFFDKIWFHGRSVLLPNIEISVTDQGFISSRTALNSGDSSLVFRLRWRTASSGYSMSHVTSESVSEFLWQRRTWPRGRPIFSKTSKA